MKLSTWVRVTLAAAVLGGSLAVGTPAAEAATTTANRPSADLWTAHFTCGTGTLDQYFPDMTAVNAVGTKYAETVGFRSWMQKWNPASQTWDYVFTTNSTVGPPVANRPGMYYVTSGVFKDTASSYRSKVNFLMGDRYVTFVHADAVGSIDDGVDHFRWNVTPGYYRTVTENYWASSGQTKWVYGTTGTYALNQFTDTRMPDGAGYCYVR